MGPVCAHNNTLGGIGNSPLTTGTATHTNTRTQLLGMELQSAGTSSHYLDPVLIQFSSFFYGRLIDSCSAGELTHFMVSNCKDNVGLKTSAAFFQVNSLVSENVKHTELSPPVILCIFVVYYQLFSVWGDGVKKKEAANHSETHAHD